MILRWVVIFIGIIAAFMPYMHWEWPLYHYYYNIPLFTNTRHTSSYCLLLSPAFSAHRHVLGNIIIIHGH